MLLRSPLFWECLVWLWLCTEIFVFIPITLWCFCSILFLSVILIYALMNRNTLLEYLLTILKSTFDEMRRVSLLSHLKIRKILTRLHAQEFVFFSKADDISILNKVMIYVQENEITGKIKIVTVLKEGQYCF